MAPFIKCHGNADTIISDIMMKFKNDGVNKVKVFSECNTLNELMNLVIIACRSLIDIGGAYLCNIGRITIGTFTLIHSYAKDTFKSVNGIIKEMNRMVSTISTLDMAMDMIGEKLETNGSIDLEYINTIELDNVSFSYDSKNILDNISCKLEKSKKYAFVGYSGCGKSTILALMFPSPYRG